MYNISQLQEALLRADAVGDVESARLFAAEIQEYKVFWTLNVQLLVGVYLLV